MNAVGAGRRVGAVPLKDAGVLRGEANSLLGAAVDGDELEFHLIGVRAPEGLDIDLLQAHVDDVDGQGFQLREGPEDARGVGTLLSVDTGGSLFVEAGLPIEQVAGLAILADEEQVGVAEVHVGDGDFDFDALAPRTGAEQVVPVLNGASGHILLVLGQPGEGASLDGFVDAGSFQRDGVNRAVVVLLEVRADGDFAEAGRAAFGVFSLAVVWGVHSWSWSVG